jgi:AcrR family transcriptional regulator
MNDPSFPLNWVRTPHQDRSRRTLERLLDAAETLLEQRGFEHVSVAEISQAAGSSVGAFYARFRDKSGLLHHLHERFCEEAMATSDATFAPERWRDASAREIVAAVVASTVALISSRRGMFRAFLLHSVNDPQFHERDARLIAHVVGRLTPLLLARRAGIGHPRPEVATAFGLEVVSGVLRERFLLSPEGRSPWPEPEDGLVTELVRVYAGYLRLAEPAPCSEASGRRAGQ